MKCVAERKKPGVTFESFVDKQIREAQENGAFDNLPGKGRPIPRGGAADDELWWIKGYLQRENLSTDALLPESLALRKEIERLPSTLIHIRFEDSVRDSLGELNARVVAWIRMPTPPLVPLSPVDIEDWVEQWKKNRAAAEAALRESRAISLAATATEAVESPMIAAKWWRRFRFPPMARRGRERRRRRTEP